MRWLLGVLVACSLLALVGRPPSGPLSICGVAPGMSRASVEAALGQPASVGLTKSDNLTGLCLTVTEYPGGLEVYYGPAGQVVNVRGTVLEAGGSVVLRQGDDRTRVRRLLGVPTSGHQPLNPGGMAGDHEVYQDLEVYYQDWRQGATRVEHLELGSRVFH